MSKPSQRVGDGDWGESRGCGLGDEMGGGDKSEAAKGEDPGEVTACALMPW